MADTKHSVSRRGFIKGVGAAATATATALPISAAAATPPPWRARGEILEQFRAAYLAEVERLAEQLRPRFEAGELYAYREDDGDAMDALEDLLRDNFGLEVGEEEHQGCPWYTGDATTAHLILAVSPFADATDDHWNHVAAHARYSATWDVLTVARRRGWYTPTADEVPHPGHTPSCTDCSFTPAAEERP